jgi:hypothetical protein
MNISRGEALGKTKEKIPLVGRGIPLSEVREKEENYLHQRRQSAGVSSHLAVGLALSGGGVRAACFALGVINWLECSGRWKNVDYVSSVSGGGYAATSVLNIPTDGGGEPQRARAEQVLAELKRDDDGYLRFSAVTLGWAFPLWIVSMILALSPLILLVGQSAPLMMGVFPIRHGYDPYAAGAVGAFFASIGAYQFIISRWRKRPTSDGQLWFFLAMIFAAVQVAAWAVYKSNAAYLTTMALTVLIWLFVWGALRLRPSHPSIVRLHGYARYAFGFASMVSAGLVMKQAIGSLAPHVILKDLNVLYWLCLGIAFVAMLADPNKFCPTVKVYYRGLKRKFGQGRDSAIHEAGGSYQDPIHLINCFSQSPAARDDEKRRARGGENFCVSRLYCGTESSGYFTTESWYVGRRRKKWQHQSIWRLAATSGAAVDIHPVRQSPLKNSLLTVFNLGLGAWVINPAFHPERRTWWPSFYLNFMAALNVHNNGTKWMRLSDGGHFENLGIYELVARECMDIVVVDAGHDPNYEFADLAYAIERCREDFGAEIDIPDLFRRGALQGQIQDRQADIYQVGGGQLAFVPAPTEVFNRSPFSS